MQVGGPSPGMGRVHRGSAFEFGRLGHPRPGITAMNYSHGFHAGNFADVVKHAVLVRVLVHLAAKPAAFRFVDTHAGSGQYDLAGPQASRNPEWRQGISRLIEAAPAPPAAELLAPYLAAVAARNRAGPLAVYPGSPALARAFLRTQDRLVACELEPRAASELMRWGAGDRRIKTVAIDGWTALNAFVPPPERRGMVLIDPPFEQADDFMRLASGLEGAHRKWAAGTYLLWYPIKERAGPDALARRLRRTGIAKVLRAEVEIGTSPGYERLAGCGVIAVNPPWRLARELAIILPELARILSGAGSGYHSIDWLAGEAAPPYRR
jgi:23S rRNA (adenine2030-N6)-methyltransferase